MAITSCPSSFRVHKSRQSFQRDHVDHRLGDDMGFAHPNAARPRHARNRERPDTNPRLVPHPNDPQSQIYTAEPYGKTTLAEHLLLNGVATGLVSDVYHMFKPTMNFTRGFMSYDYIRGQESPGAQRTPSAINMKHLPDDIANPTDRPGIAQ